MLVLFIPSNILQYCNKLIITKLNNSEKITMTENIHPKINNENTTLTLLE